MTEIFKLSASKVKTFQTCKAKYRFEYIEKFPRIERDFQIFGSFLHEVLENFHRAIIGGYIGPDNLLMSKVFKDSLNNTWKGRVTAEQTKDSFAILNSYLLLRHNSNGSLPAVKEVEKSFRLKLNDQVMLNGYIDVVQTDIDGMTHVLDYKTSKYKKYLEKDLLQLKTYAYAVMMENSSLDRLRCSYVMLKHDFDHIEREFTRTEIMKVQDRYLGYADAIQSEKLYRPSTGPLCLYCDHLSRCSAGRDYLGADAHGETDW